MHTDRLNFGREHCENGEKKHNNKRCTGINCQLNVWYAWKMQIEREIKYVCQVNESGFMAFKSLKKMTEWTFKLKHTELVHYKSVYDSLIPLNFSVVDETTVRFRLITSHSSEPTLNGEGMQKNMKIITTTQNDCWIIVLRVKYLSFAFSAIDLMVFNIEFLFNAHFHRSPVLFFFFSN